MATEHAHPAIQQQTAPAAATRPAGQDDTATDVTATDTAATDLPSTRTLSPSRALDFQSCPLLYRFRVIDRLPEQPSPAAVRGTLVHAVLEALYDLPAHRRTLDEAIDLVAPQWRRLTEEDPEMATELAAALDATGTDTGTWLRGAGDLVESYFALEDPRHLEPAARELRVEAALGSGLVLRGIVDRLDRAPTGQLRVVDYKTGRAPGPGFEARAMFQMRFYALVLWTMSGELPRMLQLMYLSTGVVLRYEPDEDDLRAMQRKVVALWAAIDRATRTGDWRANRSALCSWCSHKALCPAWGGTPPPVPSTALDAVDAGIIPS